MSELAPKRLPISKDIYWGMVFFTLAGALAGMPIGMQLFSTDAIYGRLELKVGAVCILCGALAGFAAGTILWGIVSGTGRCRPLARLLSIVVLAASLGVEFGWWHHANTPVEQWPPEGGLARLWRGILGAVVGVVIWLIDRFWLQEFSEKPIDPANPTK
jgi:hypothetical protein